jgi:hypothetical protein
MLDFLTWLYYAPAYLEMAAAIFVVCLFALPLCGALKFEDLLMLLCGLGLLSVLYF